MAQANQPLYGQGQQAQFLNNLNGLANNSIQSLQAQMARTGGVNSGALAAGANNIGLGRMGQQANYFANVPLMNRQAQLQGAQTYGGLSNELISAAPRTQTTNQTQQGTGTGYQKQTYDPSIMSDIGQGLSIAGEVAGMPGFGGGGGGGTPMPQGNTNFNNILNPNAGFSGAGSPFGAQVGGGIPGLGAGQIQPWMQPSNLMWNGGGQ